MKKQSFLLLGLLLLLVFTLATFAWRSATHSQEPSVEISREDFFLAHKEELETLRKRIRESDHYFQITLIEGHPICYPEDNVVQSVDEIATQMETLGFSALFANMDLDSFNGLWPYQADSVLELSFSDWQWDTFEYRTIPMPPLNELEHSTNIYAWIDLGDGWYYVQHHAGV